MSEAPETKAIVLDNGTLLRWERWPEGVRLVYEKRAESGVQGNCWLGPIQLRHVALAAIEDLLKRDESGHVVAVFAHDLERLGFVRAPTTS